MTQPQPKIVFLLAGAFGSPSMMPPMLGGSITNGNNLVPINYPNWSIFDAQVNIGSDMIDQALHANTSGAKMVVFGHSWGAVAGAGWLNRYGPTSSIDPDDVEFVFIGNSVRKYGGFCFDLGMYPLCRTPDETPYTVTDFARQYDGWADWPQNSLNLQADANALSGMNNVHVYYHDVKLTDPQNVSHVEGNVTYMWSPTYPVPSLGRVVWDGLASFDGPLRTQIEQGYSRPVVIPAP